MNLYAVIENSAAYGNGRREASPLAMFQFLLLHISPHNARCERCFAAISARALTTYELYCAGWVFMCEAERSFKQNAQNLSLEGEYFLLDKQLFCGWLTPSTYGV